MYMNPVYYRYDDFSTYNSDISTSIYIAKGVLMNIYSCLFVEGIIT